MENRKYIIHVIESKKEEVKYHSENARKLLTASLALEQFDNLHALTFQLNEIDKIVKITYLFNSKVLSFQSEEIRDQFLENFKELIEEAKELI